MRRYISIAIAVAAAIAVSGCAKTSQVEATGKGTIRGINALVDSPELIFLIEERPLGNVAFKRAAGFAEYDDLVYNFNFDVVAPGNTSSTRIATQLVDVVVDTEYTLVLTGTMANPSIVLWEDPERDWDGTETVFEADFTHQSPLLGNEVDLYFAPEGTIPILGQAIGSLNYGDRLPHIEFPDGVYELIITPKDDPNTFLFQSGALTSTPATRVTFFLFDPDPSITSDIAVNLVNANGGSARLFDVNSKAQLRFFHAAFGTVNVDGFLNDDFGTVVFQNVGFGELAAYTEVDSIPMPLSLTQVNNIGGPIFEREIIVAANTKTTMILGGDPTTLLFNELADEARPIAIFPVVRVTNMSVNADAVDLYLLEPGTGITEETATQFSGLPTNFDTGFFGPNAGTHELSVTLFGEILPIAAPITINVANGDIVDIMILDTADPAVVELVVFDSQTGNL